MKNLWKISYEKLHSMSEMPLLSYVPISVRTRALVYYLSVHVLFVLLQERGVIQLRVTVLKWVMFADDKAWFGKIFQVRIVLLKKLYL